MSKSIKLLVLAALLGVAVAACTAVEAGSSTVGAPAPTMPAGELSEALETGLKATLELPATLPNGESVNLTFILVNDRDQGLYVLKWYTPLEGLAGEIFRVERDGQDIPYEGILATRGTPLSSDYVLLGAGESVSGAVDLATAYDFSAPGEYTVEFLSPRISHVARTEADMAKTMDDLHPVKIPSNRVRVKIANSLDSGENLFTVPTQTGAEMRDVVYEGISFTSDPAIAADVAAETVLSKEKEGSGWIRSGALERIPTQPAAPGLRAFGAAAKTG